MRSRGPSTRLVPAQDGVDVTATRVRWRRYAGQRFSHVVRETKAELGYDRPLTLALSHKGRGDRRRSSLVPERVYLDHAATTPVRPEVFEAMQPFFGPRFGNPSSTHRWGREARAALDDARERVARCLGANSDEVCFTSGGTEGDNLAVLGPWRALRERGRRAVVCSPIEHKAVLAAVHQAAR